MATAPFRMEFERKFRMRDGEYVPDDWVHIYQPGMSQRSKTPLRVADILRVRADGDPDNPAWMAAKMRADFVRPAYEAWRKGEEMPIEGTPIGAWPALTPDQAAGLKAAGLRTVEEMANATDTLVNKIPLPNVRGLKTLAEAFLASRDQSKVAADLAQKDREMAELREQLDEMRQIVLAQSRERDEDRPRRGRPPKVSEDVAA